MFVTSYLSPEARQICKDHGVAYLDLFDNAHLKFDDVYIDWAVADKPKSEARALRSIFSPKGAAILRAVLRDPQHSWRVSELAKAANASLGHVSGVRKALLEREWIEKNDEGVALVQPDALLKTWRENYRRPSGLRLFGYTHLHGKKLDELLSSQLNARPPGSRAIFAMQSAGLWLAPFSRDPSLVFYCDEAGSRKIKHSLRMNPVQKGSNVTILVLDDECLFADACEPSPGIFCTDPITTYLDLWNGNDRDREAAEYLASELFPWL